VLLVAQLPSPKPPQDDEPVSAGPVQAPQSPRPLHLTSRDRRELDALVDEYVRTAVLRHDLERAWRLTAPEARGGETHAEWMRGELPVYPFPADPARTAWDIDYADEAEVALNVTLVPRRGARVQPEVFGVSLAPERRGKGRHWLVSAWYPRGNVSQPEPPAATPPPTAMTPEEKEAVRRATEGQIDRVWWLVPAGLLALIVLGPVLYFAVVRVTRGLRARS
jgi:hypothetical protein